MNNKDRIHISFLLVILLLISNTYSTLQKTERYALIAGANNGGPQKTLLKYAINDAQNFKNVMIELADLPDSNIIFLKEPSVSEFKNSLINLNAHILKTKSQFPQIRNELFIYYSGHADENGLLLNLNRFEYNSLRKIIDSIDTDIRIVIIDACASGNITRIKGGKKREGFLNNNTPPLTGYVFLTSSSNTEVSQESDNLKSSFFTYNLVNGLRGAADLNSDQKVSLNEAYNYSFNSTIQNTQNIKMGTQHPSYDMKLTGSGNMIITDLRKATYKLSFDKDIEGEIFINSLSTNTVIETRKTKGNILTFGLDEKIYDICIKTSNEYLKQKITFKDNNFIHLNKSSFTKDILLSYKMKGNIESSKPGFAGGVLSEKDSAFSGMQLSLIGNKAYKHKGGQCALFFNKNISSNKSYQFSIFGSNIGGDLLTGCQHALFTNKASNIKYGQLSLISNNVINKITGFQTTTISNQAGYFRGLQMAGITNITSQQNSNKGLQIGGVANINMSSTSGANLSLGVNISLSPKWNNGILAASLFNISKSNHNGLMLSSLFNTNKHLNGLQLSSLFNLSENINGLQITAGLNKAKNVKGMQIGLINISESMDGVPIGLFSYSKKGIFNSSIWTDETKMWYISLKSGSKNFFNIFSFGRDLFIDNDLNSLGFGIGTNIKAGKVLFFDLEVNTFWIVDEVNYIAEDDEILSKIRINIGVSPHKNIGFYTGLSYNFLCDFDNKHLITTVNSIKNIQSHFSPILNGWPGFSFGITAGRL